MSLNLRVETISLRNLSPALALHSFLVVRGGGQERSSTAQRLHIRAMCTAVTERTKMRGCRDEREGIAPSMSLSVGWVTTVRLETGFVDNSVVEFDE